MKIAKISPLENKFTEILTSIPNQPQALYYKGTLPVERQIAVAIVGSRKPTSYGREIATKLASQLAQRGVAIISGLALGIDAIAHQAALDVSGLTIAVQANGLDEIYPQTNQQLGEEIISSGGVLVSEYPEGTEPFPSNFLARNRIVSGLADVIVVVEATSRSGTLNTAAHALEQGRDVYAVPGNITNPTSAGCNQLIAQGAMPITNVADFADSIAPLKHPKTPASLIVGSTPLEAKIIELIQTGIRDGDELQRQTGAKSADFSTALTMLEISGTIKALGANRWSL